MDPEKSHAADAVDSAIGFVQWVAGPFIALAVGIFLLTTALIFWPVTLGLTIMWLASQ